METTTEALIGPDQMETFKQESLNRLRNQLAKKTYENYPKQSERLSMTQPLKNEIGRLILPSGIWEYNKKVPALNEDEKFLDIPLDSDDRPLHPWINEMLTDPSIGVVKGRGFYWYWGANQTADPIIVRHDLDEPHVLLIQRGDTADWALPGGMVDKHLAETAFKAAIREGEEETTVDVTSLNPTITKVYEGPLADIRIAANAWPETTAYWFDLKTTKTEDLTPLSYKVENQTETLAVGWFPLEEAKANLFGSHGLFLEAVISSLNQ